MTHSDAAGQPLGQAPDFDGTQTGGPVNLTAAQAAAQLGVSERTVRRRAKAHKLLDGWEVIPDRTPLTIRVLDSRTLRDMTRHVSDSRRTPPDTHIEPLQRENDQLRRDLSTTQVEIDQLKARTRAAETALAAAKEEGHWLKERIEAAEAERQALMSLIPKALPPARPWWRFWAKTNGGG